MTISFECHSMEDAPKDRVIMGWLGQTWIPVKWNHTWGFWSLNDSLVYPIYWAEPSDMEPK